VACDFSLDSVTIKRIIPGFSRNAYRGDYSSAGAVTVSTACRIRGGELLFDLENDPLEQDNLIEENPYLAKQLKAEADRYYEQYGEWFGEKSGQSLATLGADDLRDLKALGYIK